MDEMESKIERRSFVMMICCRGKMPLPFVIIVKPRSNDCSDGWCQKPSIHTLSKILNRGVTEGGEDALFSFHLEAAHQPHLVLFPCLPRGQKRHTEIIFFMKIPSGDKCNDPVKETIM